MDRLPGHAVHRQRPLDVLAVDGAGRADGLEDRALDALLEIVQCRREERVRRRLERGAAPVRHRRDERVVAGPERAVHAQRAEVLARR